MRLKNKICLVTGAAQGVAQSYINGAVIEVSGGMSV